MTTIRATFRCLDGCETCPLTEPVFACRKCGGLLEVHHLDPLGGEGAEHWKRLFGARAAGGPGPLGSGVWRYQEWVLPDLPPSSIVTLGEGGTPLVEATRLSNENGVRFLIKQCGQSLSGSFKDLGMTVLVSQVNQMRRQGITVPALACASTGDTSASLAAYGAAAGLRTLVLLPKGKISGAQMIQPLSHGARVIAIDTDFDGCMAHVQRLCEEEGVYLANSKNSLRIEGQKTVAFEVVQGLGWDLPDWIVIPGGNLGNVSALVAGFQLLVRAGIIDRLPRVLCAQAQEANPLFRSYQAGFAPLAPLIAGPTQASAIRIGQPVSFPKAVAALKACDGLVASVSEQDLARAARDADERGLYVCPNTAVAMAAALRACEMGTIAKNQSVVVIATAHGLKFTEFKTRATGDDVPGTNLGGARAPREVENHYSAVKDAALGA